MTSPFRELLGRPPEEAAPHLIGAHVVSRIGGKTVRIRLTEVEAYKGSEDPASHAFGGETPRNRAMFAEPGTLYVYRSYGIHWCANSAAGPEGVGWGILMRAGEIVEGEGVVVGRRGRSDGLTNGPGKLTQALAIVGDHNGTDLLDPASPIRLEAGEPPQGIVMATPRIGISRATDLHWRFVETRPVG